MDLPFIGSRAKKQFLDKAIAGADAYISRRIDTLQIDFNDPDSGSFWFRFTPNWIDLLELYELTGNGRYLDAAWKGARQYAMFVWMCPRIPNGDILVNKGGKAPLYWYLAGKGHRQLSIPEETVPAWRLSAIGLVAEGLSTSVGHRGVFMAHHAPWMLRLGYYKDDKFLQDIARSAVIGRSCNFPGYHINTARTTAYEKPDYPLREHKELSVNSFHYNHIWPHISMLFDYLITDAFVRSKGRINFPSQFIEGYAYLIDKFYGHKPGTFYDYKDVYLWMPKKLLTTGSVELNYIAARGRDRLHIALMNQSNEQVATELVLNPDVISFGAGRTYNVVLWQENKPAGTATLSDRSLNVVVEPMGITAVTIEGMTAKPKFQHKIQSLSESDAWKSDYAAINFGRAGGKQIKSVSAKPGLAPLRFETRVEGLAQGDTIEVEAIPATGARYRIGYQVAFCTPTFAGAKIFPVGDFGARGDGNMDDQAAITQAVAAAKRAGGGIVRFDSSKTYRVIGRTDLTIEPVFDLEGARNIHIQGNGAFLMIHPPDRMAHIAFAENIHISGFTVDYDPKPYYQGILTNIDVPNMTVDIELPDRYPVPEVGIAPTHTPFFGRSFIPDAPGARSGRGDNLYIEKVTRIGNERQLRLQIRKDAKGSGTPNARMRPRLQYAYDNQATEFVVPHRVYGHLGGNNIITRSSRIKLSDIRYYCVPYFWMSILSNKGPITLSNVDIQTPHPETELYVTWRDGLHIKNGRWGILIEDGDWDGAAMYDDTFALYSRRQVLVSVTGKVATLTPSFQGRETFLWQPGDWASFWSPDQRILRGTARVVCAKDVAAPHYAVTLESVPASVTPGNVVLHEESLNRNTVIRNCTTTSVGTESSTTRFRGTDVLFQNNRFVEFDLRLEFSDRLGTPRARDVVVEDTYISSVEGRVTLSRALGVVFRRCTLDGVDVLCSHSTENICFDNVAWTHMTGNILTLSQCSQAWLFGGSSRNGRTSGLSAWIERDTSSIVHYIAPPDYPAVETGLIGCDDKFTVDGRDLLPMNKELLQLRKITWFKTK